MIRQPRTKLRVGMRMMKTVLAVFVCAMIDWARGSVPFYSMLAAVITIKKDMEHTLTAGVERIISTLVGGVIGLLFLLVIDLTPIQSFTPPYYLIVALMIIPIMSITVALDRPDCAYLSTVVFLSIAIMHTGTGDSALMFALTRTVDTLIGIIVGFLVNLIPSMKKTGAPSDELPPDEPPDEAESNN